ncbi:MAG: DUF1028 domain-containing protein [Bacteroidota bacterium]
MKKTTTFIILLGMVLHSFGQRTLHGEPLASTYSIVAKDPVTGKMGVAVQSHWFSVGTLVSWGEAGVGVIATQSFVNPSFGPRGLAMMKAGMSAEATLDSLLSTDEGRDVRQVAIVDMQGRVAAHTGKSCIPKAGQLVGKNYSVQANLMANEAVWPEMAKAFEETPGPLAERMVEALIAAEAAGGDIRGKQSAAILVVNPFPTGNPWEDRVVDLRIEDHPNPTAELKRLLTVHRAYEHMNRGDLAVEEGKMDEAMKAYAKAESLFPDNEEMKFWHAVTLANTGKVEEALPLFRLVFTQNPDWKTLVVRLRPVNLLSVNDEELTKILSVVE